MAAEVVVTMDVLAIDSLMERHLEGTKDTGITRSIFPLLSTVSHQIMAPA